MHLVSKTVKLLGRFRPQSATIDSCPPNPDTLLFITQLVRVCAYVLHTADVSGTESASCEKDT